MKKKVLLLVCYGIIISFSSVFAMETDIIGSGLVGVQNVKETSAVSSGPFEINVVVDQTICATGAVQCSGTGHTPVAAGTSNHNPVRIGILILSKSTAKPVTNVTSANVTISNPFVPAGGSTVVRLDCTDCFQSGGNGLYTIYAHPYTGNWKSGSYFLLIQVKIGSRTVSALAPIEIPF